MSNQEGRGLLERVGGAGNDGGVPPEDVNAIFRDFLGMSKYPEIGPSRPRPGRGTRTIDSNEEFWRTAPTAYEGQEVALRSFVVMEWLPASPGRYFTPRAVENRNEAMQFMAPGHTEYLPLGKLQMILGGIGSVRLSAKQTFLGRTHFLGATRSGVSHEGLPIAVPHETYRDLAPRLNEIGACLCDITGTVEIVPGDIGSVGYDVGIPKYMVAVSGIDIHDRIPSGAQVSVSIIYRGAARDYQMGSGPDAALGWSFFGFSALANRKKDGPPHLQTAVEWLQDYARRHSVFPDPPIFCDFDERMDHFEMPVDFRIEDLFRGDLDARLVEKYSRRYGVTFQISNHYGDVFSNILGSTIINRSTTR